MYEKTPYNLKNKPVIVEIHLFRNNIQWSQHGFMLIEKQKL